MIGNRFAAVGITGFDRDCPAQQRPRLPFRPWTTQYGAVPANQSSALLRSITGLGVQSLFGTEAEPEYRQDEPSLEVRITREKLVQDATTKCQACPLEINVARRMTMQTALKSRKLKLIESPLTRTGR